MNILFLGPAIAGCNGLYLVIAALLPLDYVVYFGRYGTEIDWLDTRAARRSALLSGLGWLFASLVVGVLVWAHK